MKKEITAAILGTGSRGSLFGMLMQKHGGFRVTAGCDINPEQLLKFKKLLGIGEECLFNNEESFFKEKRADVLVIATFDKEHVRQCVRAMKMGYDILLEKPISDSKEEIELLLQTQRETGRTVAVCHELRYGPGYEKLSELLKSGAIGTLLAIDAMERVAYWHQAQAYVRIQSERNDVAYPTILAKCSHDLDLVQHYAGAECDTLSSVGALSFFRKETPPRELPSAALTARMSKPAHTVPKEYILTAGNGIIAPNSSFGPIIRFRLKTPQPKRIYMRGLEPSASVNVLFFAGLRKTRQLLTTSLCKCSLKTVLRRC